MTLFLVITVYFWLDHAGGLGGHFQHKHSKLEEFCQVSFSFLQFSQRKAKGNRWKSHLLSLGTIDLC